MLTGVEWESFMRKRPVSHRLIYSLYIGIKILAPNGTATFVLSVVNWHSVCQKSISHQSSMLDAFCTHVRVLCAPRNHYMKLRIPSFNCTVSIQNTIISVLYWMDVGVLFDTTTHRRASSRLFVLALTNVRCYNIKIRYCSFPKNRHRRRVP